MAQIYIIKNTVNEKVYIGKTEKCYIERFKQHCRDCKKERNEKRPLYNAMNKYGIEKFSVSLLCETDSPEKDEIRLIKEYDSYKNGYNATLGGDGKKYVNINIEQAINDYLKSVNNHIIVVAKKYGLHEDTFRTILKSKKISIRNPMECDKKAIMQINKHTGEIVNCYDCSENAGKTLGKINGSHINSCALGKRKTAYGYKWKFI